MDINIRLGGGGGSNGRQAKLSAKHTSSNAVQSIQQASNNNAKSSHKMSGGGISSAVGMASGKVGSFMGVASKVPAIAAVYLALGAVDKVIGFGTDVYKGISGEDMLASNIKAHSKTVATLGMNLVAGSINNAIFTEPRIRRQNDMKDYGRELYFNASEKNKLT